LELMTAIETSGFGKHDWSAHWSGGWCLLSCSYFGDQYTRSIGDVLGAKLHTAVFVSRNGRSTCYLRRDELEEFGGYLAKKVVENEGVALEWCTALKRQTDRLAQITSDLGKKEEITQKEFGEFLSAFYDYVGPHIAVKKVVDYLPQAELERLLPKFTEARLYSEKVYDISEEFTRLYSVQVGAKAGLPANLVQCMLKEELEDWFGGSKTPGREELESRFEQAALVFIDGKHELLNDVQAVEKSLHKQGSSSAVKGTPASPGRAVGVARVVLDPRNAGEFNEGDILVTGMTRPEYTPLVKKASAIVTDAGGVLCHAAIIARELKKPCVVGTHNATKLFKTGDKIEVDADKGTATKLPA